MASSLSPFLSGLTVPVTTINKEFLTVLFSHECNEDRAHTDYRVAMANFWRTFNHDGKISPAWWWWGVHAHPLSLDLPSRAKLWCTLQLRGQIHSPYFYSTPICTLWY